MKLIPIYEIGSNRVIGWENRTSPDEIRSALSKRKPLFHIVYSTSFYSKRVKYVHIMYGTYTLVHYDTGVLEVCPIITCILYSSTSQGTAIV